MAVRVAARGDDGGQPLLGDAEEGVRVRGGAHGVDRDLHAAVGAVLEADRHRQARGELAVHLALRRARADRAPRHEVGVNWGVIGSRNSVPAGSPSSIRSISRRRARRRPSLMAKLPSRCGSLIRPFQPTVVRGFSKYTRITMQRSAASSSRQLGEAPGVVEARDRVVDRARPDHDDEPVVLAAQDPRDFVAAAARRWPSSPRWAAAPRAGSRETAGAGRTRCGDRGCGSMAASVPRDARRPGRPAPVLGSAACAG